MKRFYALLSIAFLLSAQTSDLYPLQPADTASVQTAYQNFAAAQKSWNAAVAAVKSKYGISGDVQFTKDFKTAIGSGPGIPPITPTLWRAGFWTFNHGQPLDTVPFSSLTHMTLCCAASVGGVISVNWLEPASFPSILSAAHAAGVKVILSVGGDVGAATVPSQIATYSDSIVKYVNANGFDGVDMDWEQNIVVAQYKDLIDRLRAGLPSKLITMDTGDWDNLVPASVATYPKLDRLNVMTYDMANGAGISWHNSAVLRVSPTNPGGACDYRTAHLTAAGVPPGKLNIGIPAYGYSFSGATTWGVAGATFSGQQFWYSAIKNNPTWWAGGANHKYDTVHKADYLSVAATNQFITYNDTTAVNDVTAWGRSISAGGFFFAYIEQQYISGAAGDARNPLVSALASALGVN